MHSGFVVVVVVVVVVVCVCVLYLPETRKETSALWIQEKGVGTSKVCVACIR